MSRAGVPFVRAKPVLCVHRQPVRNTWKSGWTRKSGCDGAFSAVTWVELVVLKAESIAVDFREHGSCGDLQSSAFLNTNSSFSIHNSLF